MAPPSNPSKLLDLLNPFTSFPKTLSLSIIFRVFLLLWGSYQDAHSPLKYTDIDYQVFTSASTYISHNQSPYLRETYRYTPLLAWLLYPTTFPHLFDFGKWVFAAGDIVTGVLIYAILRKQRGMQTQKALGYAGIWLLNPMVANISTRGSSEGLLAVIVVAVLWAAVNGYARLAGVLLGLAVHFKIYPFVYAVSVFWWWDDGRVGNAGGRIGGLLSRQRVQLAMYSFVAFNGLNLLMVRLYGSEFLTNSYTYHLTRLDHRHNFSIYNTLLHLKSALNPYATSSPQHQQSFGVESLAFLPQLFLSVIAIPFLLAKKDLPGTMMAQTFAFVTFNKVCTSQYFLWYMVFLPFYLPTSSFLHRPKLGYTALALWILGQAMWLQQGYQLEFLGHSTFVPGLWMASVAFFGVNCWILGIVVSDIGNRRRI